MINPGKSWFLVSKKQCDGEKDDLEVINLRRWNCHRSGNLIVSVAAFVTLRLGCPSVESPSGFQLREAKRLERCAMSAEPVDGELTPTPRHESSDSTLAENEEGALSDPIESVTTSSSRGIPFKQAFDILSNREACDHVHSVRGFYDGTAPSEEEVKVADEAFPKFEFPDPEEIKTWSALQLLVQLLRLQEARVEIYHHFNSAFETLLETRNFTPYRLACHRVTTRFAALSQGVRLVREYLRSIEGEGVDGIGGHGAPGGLCETITNLQAAEKRKLETTAQLQLLRQHLTLRKEEDASHRHQHDHSDHDVHGPEVEKASVADLTEAVHLQNAALAEIIDEINSIVEDLRCERADMTD